eukprot:Cvel_4246.t3-p1 / transcript=Cvel_4246.t3 / gene=Cvel_4246 / organism=Chromera_velia_CCMP2878 / gene_product=hypothetical protein / transcript_product=hypothetical protein / location=Cvel_scaffold184:5069-6141(+) / protein_length=357 / sequence_SO=supercontig / SO=protein_coding / is_pseudo=false
MGRWLLLGSLAALVGILVGAAKLSAGSFSLVGLMTISVAVIAVSVSASRLTMRRDGPRGLLAQSFHYFSRPSTGTLDRKAIEALQKSESAWKGEALERNTNRWCRVLSEEEVRDAIAAVTHAETALLRGGASLSSLRLADFPLNALAKVVQECKRELKGVRGLGFILLRGLPLDRWSESQAELFFWGLGMHLGVPGAQNNNGDLLGHVIDLGGDPDKDRQFKTNVKIDLHCDAADVVGLLCLHPSRKGTGLSSLVSSVSVLCKLWEEQGDSETVSVLQQSRFHLDTRGSGGINFFTLPVVAYSHTGEVKTFWHSEYFRSWVQYPDAPRQKDSAAVAALDAWDEIAERPGFQLHMELQ